MGVFVEEVMLDLPRVVDAEPIGEFDLIECLLKHFMLGAFTPGARELVFVKNPELQWGLSLR